MKNPFKALWGKLFPPKRYVYLRVDYVYGEPVWYKTNVVKNRVGVIWLFDPLVLELGEGGKTILADKEYPGYGKVWESVKWFDEYDGPCKHREYGRKELMV